MKYLFGLLIAVVLVAALFSIDVLLIRTVWNWHLVPMFGMPVLTFKMAFVVDLCLSFVIPGSMLSVARETENTEIGKRYFASRGLVFVVAYVIYLF